MQIISQHNFVIFPASDATKELHAIPHKLVEVDGVSAISAREMRIARKFCFG